MEIIKMVFWFLVIVLTVLMIYAYRHDLLERINVARYGKKKYAIIQAMKYGEYQDFLKGFYNLAEFTKVDGKPSYRILTNEEKDIVALEACRRGFIGKFLEDVPEDIRIKNLYREGVKETPFSSVALMICFHVAEENVTSPN